MAPAVEVLVQYQSGLTPRPSAAIIRQTAQRTVEALGYLPACSIAVQIADDAELAALNLQFRRISKPTDILSFPSGETDPETGRVHLGDLAISLPRAAAQARAAKHALMDEIRLLVVHGTLHLFGFDHNTPARKQKMWTQQTAILENFATRPAKSTGKKA